MAEDRATVLLKATLEILNKCANSPFELDVLGETAFYDDTDCDGFCLKEDIEHFLEFGDD